MKAVTGTHRRQSWNTPSGVGQSTRAHALQTHAMATLLPSMMMCLRSAEPGSLANFRV